MQIEEGVFFTKAGTPSEICIILYIMQKPNPIISDRVLH